MTNKELKPCHPEHKHIWLIPDSWEGQPCYVWCEDPAPSIGMEPEDAIEYVRIDIYHVRGVRDEMREKQDDTEMDLHTGKHDTYRVIVTALTRILGEHEPPDISSPFDDGWGRDRGELLKYLAACAEDSYPEKGHLDADNALLRYINDDEITDAFNKIVRWYE
jgi:hypothetical protein